MSDDRPVWCGDQIWVCYTCGHMGYDVTYVKCGRVLTLSGPCQGERKALRRQSILKAVWLLGGRDATIAAAKEMNLL